MDETIFKVRNIPIAIPSFGREELEALYEPMSTGWLTQGPKVSQFEKSFSKIHDVKSSLAVTSCTTGLHLVLQALGIGPGDEVIVPAFTWIATANVVLYCGATPVFCDIDVKTYNIDVNSVLEKVTDKTKAIIAVHLFGLCADIDAIKNIIPSYIHIIEDAACAAGASYKGQMAGSLGIAGVFSFHPRKSITTGEGGMITTSDEKLSRLLETMRNHGAEIPEEVRHHSSKPYDLPDFKVLGYNYRMTDLQAAIGVVQLAKLNNFIEERSQLANLYTENLQNIDWLIPQSIPKYITQHAWQSYVCYVDPDKAPQSRNQIMERLQQMGISTRPGTHAIHMLSYYKEKYGYKPDDFLNAKKCAENTMAIPLHNAMKKDDVEYIMEAINGL